MDCSIQVHFLKKTIQILVSIYVFSLFFSQTSLANAMLNYLDHYFSTFSIKLFHYNSERNYIFLLFNGILAVILKNSGLISKSSMMNTSYQESMKEKNHHNFSGFSRKEATSKPEEEKEEEEEEEEGQETGILETATSAEEIPEMESRMTERVEVEEEDETESVELQTKEVLNGEEEHGLMSREELNRKCEEFIKKMKEGIKVDLQKQIMG